MFEQFEQYGIFALVLGALLLVIGAIGLLIASFRERLSWGFAVMLLPGVGAVAFVFAHFRKSVRPLLVMLAGGLVIGGTYGLNYYLTHFVDLGPREKMVEGELHITLTGWDKDDYSVIAAKPDVVVLQMANEDVTDQTLEHLRGLTKLRELDLNTSQVSDQGLVILKELPALQILRLRKTKVTDDGFSENLAGKESLLELDVRETEIKSKTMREWKAKRKDERKYLK
ncbi:MAG: hypothetical protein AB7K24_02265 [Gemmataceae bacterium]